MNCAATVNFKDMARPEAHALPIGFSDQEKVGRGVPAAPSCLSPPDESSFKAASCRLARMITLRKNAAIGLLLDILEYSSVQGGEGAIQSYLCKAFRRLGYETELHSIPEKIRGDEEYTHSDARLDYQKRCNLVVRIKGQDGGRSVILNTHSDIAPAAGWNEAFRPERRGDLVVGCGACDAKGQIAAIWLTLAALKASGIKLKGDVIVQLVIEEEVGGNGSLALIRAGIRADGVVVMEPTELNAHPANRGALWFRCALKGRSVHMGRKQEGISAIDEAFKVIAELKSFERCLLRKAKAHPLFRRHSYPAQVNVGVLRGGNWPATVPGQAVLEGGIGFTPNVKMADVKRELKAILARHSGEWIKNNHRLEFPKIHNDAYEIPVRHPLAAGLIKACRLAGIKNKTCGWTASCDARLFYHAGRMPVVVFGAGRLGDAHSDGEKIKISEIARCAQILGIFLVRWCGLARTAK